MKKMEILIIWFGLLFLLLIFVVFIAINKYSKIWKLTVTSPDFNNNEFLSSKFSCEWENLIPRLYITEIPINTKSLAIIIEDPDASKETFIHFVAWGIKTDWKTSLSLFEDNNDNFLGLVRWKNSFENLEWWWPCPPKWHWVHRYYFKIYAVNIENLDLKEWANKEELLNTMQGYNLSYWEIVGLYKRD